jgi:hypothetical protein
MLAKSAQIPQKLFIKITSYKIDLNFDSFYRRIFLSVFSAPRVDLHCTFCCRIANITFPYFWQTWAPSPPHLRADSANIGEFWRIFHQSCRTPSTWRSSILRYIYSIHKYFSVIFYCDSIHLSILSYCILWVAMVLKFCPHTAKTQYRKFETNIPREGIARPQSQHSCVSERFIYSQDGSA